MKNIESFKKRWFHEIAKKSCPESLVLGCKKKSCDCMLSAEILAYIKLVIPSPYETYTIKDFDGRSEDDKDVLLEPASVKVAKERLIRYCWDETVTLENIDTLSDEEFDAHSIMDIRRWRDGENVVIFAGSKKADEYPDKATRKGKSLIASIIMQEAIKRRASNDQYPNIMQNYGWINYQTLKWLLHRDENDAYFYRGCDWLVVDDIERERVARYSDYMRTMIDPFFIERLEAKRPTILVFRRDIDNEEKEVAYHFGVGISKVTFAYNTYKIVLT